MSIKKKSSDANVEVKEELVIDNQFINRDSPAYFKDFNFYYEEFMKLDKDGSLTKEDERKRLEYGVEAAIIIANSFDFNETMLKSKKSDYVNFARNILYEAGGHPNNDAKAMIYLIKALYGYTNIAYSHINEHKLVNIEDGNEWVEYLEKNAKNRVLKAYSLTLRAFQYIVNGELLSMSVKQRINKSEKDLIYATKWDEDNYYAYYALGLIYLDSGTSKYDKEKAITNFKKVLEYKDKYAELDNYLTDIEKEKAMENAKKKIDILNN